MPDTIVPMSRGNRVEIGDNFVALPPVTDAERERRMLAEAVQVRDILALQRIRDQLTYLIAYRLNDGEWPEHTGGDF